MREHCVPFSKPMICFLTHHTYTFSTYILICVCDRTLEHLSHRPRSMPRGPILCVCRAAGAAALRSAALQSQRMHGRPEIVLPRRSRGAQHRRCLLSVQEDIRKTRHLHECSGKTPPGLRTTATRSERRYGICSGGRSVLLFVQFPLSSTASVPFDCGILQGGQRVPIASGALRAGLCRGQCDAEMCGPVERLPNGDARYFGYTVEDNMHVPGNRIAAAIRMPRLASFVVAESVHCGVSARFSHETIGRLGSAGDDNGHGCANANDHSGDNCGDGCHDDNNASTDNPSDRIGGFIRQPVTCCDHYNDDAGKY